MDKASDFESEDCEFESRRVINVASTVITIIIVASRVTSRSVIKTLLTRVYYSHIRRPFAQQTGTIFELIQDIIKTNDMIQYIIGTNLRTKFHDDRTINVASRVLTRFYNSHIRINAPPKGGHVFQPTRIMFERNLLTKFHKDRTKCGLYSVNKEKCNAPWRRCFFQATVTIFEVVQDIIETNLLTKFYEDLTINVASRVITRKMLTPHDAPRTKGDHKSSP
ncbi:hypothetical protein DPMN_078180 [Dreissena polymorpha]|uniref:Uncharacterized protein n=1 Tax=Dreissena polymorpha TaxID=45954 RepID=A0A9D3YQ19_DREPO|nr:hypothetical protein DPMN_078180 [Dreissena polymorpha]